VGKLHSILAQLLHHEAPVTLKSRLFAEYAEFHKDGRNKVCHFVGIPLIVGTLIGMLTRWDLAFVGNTGISAGHLLLAAGTVVYAFLAPAMALPMLAAAGFLGAIGRALPLPVAAALFALGWVFQFVGHIRYEGRSPAFLKNGMHFLIGPLWVLESAMGRSQ
jgi:uncharacterized membrane protein YGL010W